jgi:hypothetical protein
LPPRAAVLASDPEWREEAIAKHDDRKGSDCGSPELNSCWSVGLLAPLEFP